MFALNGKTISSEDIARIDKIDKIIKDGIKGVLKHGISEDVLEDYAYYDNGLNCAKFINDNRIEVSEEEKEKILNTYITRENLFFMKIRVKNNDDSLLKFLKSHHYEILNSNSIKSKEDESLDAIKKFVRYNRYDNIGRLKYDEETYCKTFIPHKDKNGKAIKVEKGVFFKCECGNYELAKEIDFIVVLRGRVKTHSDNSFYVEIAKIAMTDIKCSCCENKFSMEDIPFFYDASKITGFVSKDIFDDYKERGKIVYANVKKELIFVGDKYISKSISTKMVFNINTGRSYFLPNYDIKTQKKLTPLKQLGDISIRLASMDFKIDIKDTIKLGKVIEKSMLSNENMNHKAIIPFDKYICDAFKSTLDKNADLKEDLRKLLAGEEIKPNVKLLSRFSFYTLVDLLKSYNANPYIDNKTYKIAESFRSEEPNRTIIVSTACNKAKRMKKIRQMELAKELLDIFNIKTKTERNFVKDAENRNIYTHVYYTKKIFKDPNNVNKILQTNMKSRKRGYAYSYINIYENKYLEALIENFGETAVANALVKEVTAYNDLIDSKMKKNEFGNLLSLNQADRCLYYADTIDNYEKIISAIPTYKLPCSRLRLKDLHDKIAMDANKIKIKKKSYIYEEKFMNHYDNKKINDITFKVATSNRRLVHIGSEMRICVGGYNHRVEAGELFIVYMLRDDSYIGCLEVSRLGELHQAKAKGNALLSQEDQIVLDHYCSETGIKINTSDFTIDKKPQEPKNKAVTYNKAIKFKIETEVSINETESSIDYEEELIEDVPF